MENIRAQFRKHVLLLGVVFGLYSCILLVSGGFALNGLEGSAGFDDAKQMGMALGGILGVAGPVCFSIGLFICAFTTLTVVAQLGSYFILDCLGRNWRFEKANRVFLIPFVFFVIAPAIITVFWDFPSLLKVVISMVFNCLVAPLAVILIFFLINRRQLAGELKASPLRNLLLVYSMAVVLFTSVRAVQGIWKDFAEILGLT